MRCHENIPYVETRYISDPELPNIEIQLFWLHRSIDC